MKRMELRDRLGQAEARVHALQHLVAALVRKYGGETGVVILTPVEIEGAYALKITPFDGFFGPSFSLELLEEEDCTGCAHDDSDRR